ncbi:uncharacterized protein M6G45_015660 isoform 1-T1 [Spheniscus humboldti]
MFWRNGVRLRVRQCLFPLQNGFVLTSKLKLQQWKQKDPEYVSFARVPCSITLKKCLLLTVETWSWRRNHLTRAPDPELPEVDRTVSRGAGGRVAEPCCPAWIYGEASNCDGLAKHSKITGSQKGGTGIVEKWPIFHFQDQAQWQLTADNTQEQPPMRSH